MLPETCLHILLQSIADPQDLHACRNPQSLNPEPETPTAKPRAYIQQQIIIADIADIADTVDIADIADVVMTLSLLLLDSLQVLEGP